jgi:RNA polymerase sigma-70 factor (ECF subfamily)
VQRSEESALVRRVAGGDRAAFSVLVQAPQRPLSAYARRMLTDADRADDIVQEVFLRLWLNADRYDPTAARLTTWLHNIAHNLCIDSYRKLARINEAGDFDLESAPEHTEPEDRQLAAQRARQVRDALAALPERQRSALLLCHYQGLSNREAAAILALSVEALESLLARARRRLKKDLEISDAD